MDLGEKIRQLILSGLTMMIPQQYLLMAVILATLQTTEPYIIVLVSDTLPLRHLLHLLLRHLTIIEMYTIMIQQTQLILMIH